MTSPKSSKSGGAGFALSAYLVWGLMPLYFSLVHTVLPLEFVGWRAMFTLPTALLLVAGARQWGELKRVLSQPRLVGVLAASAAIIGANWLIYLWAIQQGHIYAASLGYYINPLCNVLLGTVLLKERLSRGQWFAVALAAAGTSLLAWEARQMLWLSLAIALSFSLYGLIRKLVPVGAMAGLGVETILLAPPALLLLAVQPGGLMHSSFGHDWYTSLVIAAAGIVTAVPLLLFTAAAQRMDYSALGFFQFIAPTMVFLEGLLIFREPLKLDQLACFILIWSAIAVFVWDLLASKRQLRRVVTA